jgi:hypothetical protein
MMGDLGRCEYCNRSIRFVPTRKGKKMPLDPDPSPAGTVVIEVDPTTGARVARVLSRGEVPTTEAYVSHFATCTNARHYTPDNIRRALERKRAEHGGEVLGDRLRPCSVQYCTELIERRLLVCRAHWRLIPGEIQRAILKHSQPRQVWDEPGPGEVAPALACRSAASAALEAIARARSVSA